MEDLLGASAARILPWHRAAASASVLLLNELQLRWRLKSRATWRTRALSRFMSTISTAQAYKQVARRPVFPGFPRAMALSPAANDG
jgi:hypothetical protein